MTYSRSTSIRNAVVLGGSGLSVGLLLLYPTSTNSGAGHRHHGQARAPAGVVPPSDGAGLGTAARTTVVNGPAIDTRYGPVQVQITVRGGHLLKATAVDYPQGGGRDRQINGYAIPLLQQETISAQSAQVGTISGATYTSDGYRQSLQAALDSAQQG